MMRLARRRSRRVETPEEGIAGRARVDRRTKRLLTRVEPGDIAVVDHADMDRLAAEGLVQRKVAAVLNAAPTSTGLYPNLGALLLVSAGIHLVDDIGPEVMSVPEGTKLVVDGDRIIRVVGDERAVMAKGTVVTLEAAEKTLDEAKRNISQQLEAFALNTIEYIRDEREVLLEAARLPEVKTDFHGRHVLVVVRGYDYKEDLAHLRSYIKEVEPVLVGVDGGADALLDFRLKPDLIVGDMDSVSTEALLCGAEIVVHAYPGGGAPGLERLEALDIPCVVFEAPGTSEDIALLLAFERGAELIVAVGTHANLVELMDKGRKGMASTFLTRLRVGPILVDAKGVSRLYGAQIKRSDVVILVGAAFVSLAIAVAASQTMQNELMAIGVQLQDLWFRLTGALFG